MKKDKQISTQDLKFLAKPMGIFMAVLLVFGFSVFFGISKIKQVNQKLQTAKQLQGVLGKNVVALRSVEEEMGQQNFIEVALPTSNASVYFLSLAKKLAFENQLILSNLKTGVSVEEGKGLSKSTVSFDVEGSAQGISNFIASITKSLPIASVDKVKTTLSGGVGRSSISVNVYSAELPEKIPSLTTPVTSLSADEKSLLLDLTKYSLPLFIKPEPLQPVVRDNPFE